MQPIDLRLCNCSAINISGLSAGASKPKDCTDIAALGCADNGVYTIYIGAQQRPLSVYCDMKTANNSWTVMEQFLQFCSTECNR